MRDPVAEVLAERSARRGGLSAAIAVSFVLHAAGGALAVYAGLQQPPLKAAPRVNIRLAQAPATPAVRSPAVAPSTAPPEPVAPRIEEPRPEPVEPPPQKAPEPPKNTAPASPFGRSTKKPAEAVPPPAPQPPASVASQSTVAGGLNAPIGIGEAGVTGVEGGDFPYTIYLEQMENLIGRRWVRPTVTGEIASVIYFRIGRDGTIRDVSLTAPSGNGMFDRAAQRAVLEASPLPPLPFGYSGTYLGVHLTFR